MPIKRIVQVLEQRPDAVITEIGAGDWTRLSLCRNIVERAPGTPVLLVRAGRRRGSLQFGR
jgi:hypothetical protein